MYLAEAGSDDAKEREKIKEKWRKSPRIEKGKSSVNLMKIKFTFESPMRNSNVIINNTGTKWKRSFANFGKALTGYLGVE